jgi:putative chitinase
MIDAPRWHAVLLHCGVRESTAAEWAPLFERHIQPERFSLGQREIDDFVAQVLHETTRLEHLTENLNYRAERLMEVWPKRFPNRSIAGMYQWRPEALGNFVYGGRMGNDQEGDGFRYLGRGIPMVTGKANYLLLQQLTGLPLVSYPTMLADPDTALRCAVLWWEKKVPDEAIDTLERVSRAVNGGTVGLEDRRLLARKAAEALA